MIGIDSHAARYTGTIVLVLLLFATIYAIRRTLFIFALAVLFAYMLWPLVRFLDRRLPGRSKAPALVMVYVLLVGTLILASFAVTSAIAGEAATLASKVPAFISRVNHSISLPSNRVGELEATILDYTQDQLASNSDQLTTLLSKGAVAVLSRFEGLFIVILVPILSFFCLKDGETILQELFHRIGDGSRRKQVKNIASDIHNLLARYIRARVLLALAALVAYGALLELIRAPYPILLSAIAAVLEFIPLIGPLIGAIIVLLAVGVSQYHSLLAVAAFLIAYRIFQDYVLSPYLLSAGMELHPLFVIFGVMAGTELAGFRGALLSVPALAMIRIVYRQLTTIEHASRTIDIGASADTPDELHASRYISD